MTYLVTARKWRPQKFDEVVGQSHITKTLKNSIENNRIAHAYIFAGPRGVGKTTTARILAKRLNCSNPQGGEPCNECEMCQMFGSQQTMDIIEIDGASNRRIDEIRTLRESVKYAPTTGKFKVYIIDEVHMLTTESFNALLKTLEEPPEHTVFIFATTDVHKVPLTIISRCQRFDFRRIELKEIKALLSKISKAEGIEIDDKSLTIIAKKADGALRDAQSLFDQVVSYCGKKITAEDVSMMLNLIDEEIYFDLTDAILTKKFETAFTISQKIYENGWNFIDFMNGLLEHFRNLLTVVITGESKLIEAGEMTRKRLESFKDSFSESDLLRILNFVSKLSTEVKLAQNQKLRTEIGLTQIIGLERSATITELVDLLKNDKDLTSKLSKLSLPPEDKKKTLNEIKAEDSGT
ncbi:MAG: DNA polymerase III subunit gamma/tau, partial [Ignavibacteria bacterium]